jgi:hypothetical protein
MTATSRPYPAFACCSCPLTVHSRFAINEHIGHLAPASATKSDANSHVKRRARSAGDFWTIGGNAPTTGGDYPEGAFIDIDAVSLEELADIPELLPLAEWFQENYPR